MSIITPCYNHGQFLDEMLASVHDFSWPFEIEQIIIDDGSTDEFTKLKCSRAGELERVKVVRQENQGLAKTRNHALALARGKYILPLDADNKIFPEIFAKAAGIMEGEEGIGVVYTDARYFGEKDGIWAVEDYDIGKILYTNQFDACALIRKSLFDLYGSYDENMPAMGHEDWELWVRLGLNGCDFYHFKEIGFSYRVLNNSMVNTLSTPNWKKSRKYIFSKHAALISDSYDDIFAKMSSEKEEAQRLNAIVSSFRTHKIKSIAKLILNRV